jgi:hypothetical protein
MGGPISHDVYRQITGVDISPGSSGGAAASTSVFDTQTYAVRLIAAGPVSSVSGSAGIRYKIVTDGDVVSSTADTLLPLNWVETVKVTPGQRVSAIGNDAGASYKLTVVELTD